MCRPSRPHRTVWIEFVLVISESTLFYCWSVFSLKSFFLSAEALEVLVKADFIHMFVYLFIYLCTRCLFAREQQHEAFLT